MLNGMFYSVWLIIAAVFWAFVLWMFWKIVQALVGIDRTLKGIANTLRDKDGKV